MTNQELAKAREWAKSVGKTEDLMSEPRAAVEVIQSLPDHWVDIEKVREIMGPLMNSYEGNPRNAIQAIIDLITPKLPTLEDMNEDDRNAMVGNDVKVEGWNSPSMLIAVHKNEGAVLGHSWINPWPFVEIRPLSELSPANGAVPTVAEQENDVPDQAVAKDACNSESDPIHTPMQPSEVPANEPWLIEVDGQKAVGTRYQDYAVSPWSVAPLDGSFAADHMDSEVTLIRKLVPEPPALPEGMRLADHKEYGRVVVSPETDIDGDYKAFHSDPGNVAGADWHFAYESDLTFLDGKGKESKNG